MKEETRKQIQIKKKKAVHKIKLDQERETPGEKIYIAWGKL